MKVRSSALRHGIESADSIHVATWPQFVAPIDYEHPQREFRLGFDTKGRLLELVVLTWDDGSEEIIHAMKARRQYLKLLP